MDALYSAKATAVGGREGHVETDDGFLKIDMSMPKSLGGQGRPNTTNPEQLFAMGYAACFGGAVGFVAKQKKITVESIAVTATVHIGRQTDGLGLGVELSVKVAGVDQATAEQLVHAAHQVCPYSKATRNNIEVKLSVG